MSEPQPSVEPELPVEVVLDALTRARELLGQCEASVREQPDMFRGIRDFLLMRGLNNSVRSGVIGLDGAISVAHGKRYPNPTMPEGQPGPEHQAAPSLPPLPGPEHQAVLNDIDQTP